MGLIDKLKKSYSKNRETIYIVLLVLIAFFCVIIYKYFLKSKDVYTVVNGYVEKTTDTVAYIVKDEKTIDILNNANIPVVEQGKRVAKGDVVAVYKNAKYDSYLETIDSLDKEIKTIIKDLPTVYSSDINDIDNQIEKLVKEAKGETSSIKMQEYKVKIDELSYKKVNLLGELSPVGSKIRELISKRKEYEHSNQELADAIRATYSGIVSYKIDNLESVISANNLLKCNIQELNTIMSKYRNNYENNYGIKIVDNFDAYILVKEARGLNDIYIHENKKYNIKLTDKNNELVPAILVSHLQDDEYNYCIFKISNFIENLVDLRTTSVEVVWTKVNGMAVPTKLIMNSNGDIGYVKVIKGGQYLDIPVRIKLANDEISIVQNLNNDEKQAYGTTEELKNYDQIVNE